MTHHQGNVSLRQMVERSAFGKDPPDEFVRYLNTALLVGALRVTVEHSCSDFAPFVTFQRYRICEFTASVSENYREQPAEIFSTKPLVQFLDNICYRTSCVGVPDVGQHKVAVAEE